MGTQLTRAWRVTQPGPMNTHPLRPVRESPPRPAADELLVRVLACGVCRTDLHVTEGDLPVHRLDVVPGHEVVGEVVEAPNGEFAVGQRLGIAWLRHTCGQCRYCTRGSENLCPRSEYTGWDADGGYADYTTVPADYAYPLPHGYPDAELARLSSEYASEHLVAEAAAASGFVDEIVSPADTRVRLAWALRTLAGEPE